MDPRRQAVLAAADSEIGPGDPAKYWASCGISPAPKPGTKGGEWCGAFTLWCLKQAGLAQGVKWIPGIGYVIPQGLVLTRSPEPGDIMYDNNPYQHYGIVESLENGILTTIEGNTPTVQRRSRPLPADFAFYSINKLLGLPASKPPSSPPPKPSPQPTPKPVPDVTLLRGIDVSHHQPPGALSWSRLAETHRFVIARATYGIAPDKTFREHVRRALDVGLAVGAYHFFRPGQSVVGQHEAFCSAVDSAGMGPGWVTPTLDVESDKNDGPTEPARYALAEQLIKLWIEQWGQAMLYTNVNTWVQIGNPKWIERCYLWVAHHGAAKPVTPLGLEWTLWQHLVAPLPGVYATDIDQDVARFLPTLAKPMVAELLPLEQDLEERRRDRDASIRDEEN